MFLVLVILIYYFSMTESLMSCNNDKERIGFDKNEKILEWNKIKASIFITKKIIKIECNKRKSFFGGKARKFLSKRL
jgi:hypothetical protein